MADNGELSRGRAEVLAEEMNFPSSVTRKPAVGARLGEELPVFCEKCGYSLHGLVQVRCAACDVLHFACPECNHHQPINTLRPAFQRLLGRLRAIGLAFVVFLKINFFFWPLFGFGALGGEIAYRYNWDGNSPNATLENAKFDEEGGIILFLLAAAFAAIGRMLLLRWGRGVLVGLTLAGLVVFAMVFGALLWQMQMSDHEPVPSPVAGGFVAYLLCAFAGAVIGGAVAWGVWLALAHAFLPKRTAAALIEWQSTMSAPASAPDRTDATTSVTV